MENKIDELNIEITNLLEITSFFNKNFEKIEQFNSKNSRFYFASLTQRFKDFSLKKEKLLKEIKREAYD